MAIDKNYTLKNSKKFELQTKIYGIDIKWSSYCKKNKVIFGYQATESFCE